MTERVNKTGDNFFEKVSQQNKQNPDGFDVTGLVDRYSLDAFADACFDYQAGSLDDEDALLYRFMKEFNHSAAADNPVAGLARMYSASILLFFRRIFRSPKQYFKIL